MTSQQAENVWDLASAHSSAHIAAALADGTTVEVWNLRTKRRLSRFAATHDFGGNRLAISGDGRLVAAALYTAGKITCYTASTGESKWTYKARKCQNLVFSADSKHLFAGFDSRAMLQLDCETGKCVREIPGATNVFPSPLSRHIAEDRNRLTLYGSGDRLVGEITTLPYVAAVAYSPTALALSHYCLSDDKNPDVECVSLRSGLPKWRREIPSGGAFLALAWNPSRNRFLGFHHIGETPSRGRLVEFSPDKGVPFAIAEFEFDTSPVFALAGERLVFRSGNVYSTATGQRLAHLPFGSTSMPAK